jgi:glucose-1-phosphatase
MIKIIIFDIGGVIVSPEIEKIDKLMADYLRINPAKFKIFWEKYQSDLSEGKISLLEFYSKASERFGLKKNLGRKIIEKHFSIFRKIIKNLNKEVLSVVGELKNNYRVVCLVNAELDVIPLVKKRGIYDYFQRAYISAKLGMKKPDKKIYLTILDDFKLKPKEAIFIDDKKENVNAAKKLGIIGINYKYGENLEKKLRSLGIKI